jgi:hypothetical protein
MAELQALSDHLGAMLIKLSDVERRKLEMSIGRKLRGSQKKRITRQQNLMAVNMYLGKISYEKKNKIKIKCSMQLKCQVDESPKNN